MFTKEDEYFLQFATDVVVAMCECDNEDSRFYQDHGCCEACFYDVVGDE